MFDFMCRSGVWSPSAAIRVALERDGLPPGIDSAFALRVVEASGVYAGRGVTSIRVFDPARAAEQGLCVRVSGDLDAHPELVLRTGHVERDGTAVIPWRAPPVDADQSVREPADHAAHRDDEQLVLPGESR